jgi:hypothetical protein
MYISSNQMNNDARKYLASLFEAYLIPMEYVPTVFITVHDTDYCGMFIGNNEGNYMAIVLNYTNVCELAEIENIDLYQAIYETVFHEFIHFIQHLNDEPLEHDGVLWYSMVQTGLDMGLIHREAI